MIKYKIDVLSALKERGYNTTRLRREKILGERVIQQFRDNEIVSWATINKLCEILDLQVGDIVEHVSE